MANEENNESSLNIYVFEKGFGKRLCLLTGSPYRKQSQTRHECDGTVVGVKEYKIQEGIYRTRPQSENSMKDS